MPPLCMWTERAIKCHHYVCGKREQSNATTIYVDRERAIKWHHCVCRQRERAVKWCHFICREREREVKWYHCVCTVHLMFYRATLEVLPSHLGGFTVPPWRFYRTTLEVLPCHLGGSTAIQSDCKLLQSVEEFDSYFSEHFGEKVRAFGV